MTQADKRRNRDNCPAKITIQNRKQSRQQNAELNDCLSRYWVAEHYLYLLPTYIRQKIKCREHEATGKKTSALELPPTLYIIRSRRQPIWSSEAYNGGKSVTPEACWIIWSRGLNYMYIGLQPRDGSLILWWHLNPGPSAPESSTLTMLGYRAMHPSTELSMDPFCVTRPNPTHGLTQPMGNSARLTQPPILRGMGKEHWPRGTGSTPWGWKNEPIFFCAHLL